MLVCFAEEKKVLESLTDSDMRQLRDVCETLDIRSVDARSLARELTLMDHAVFAMADADEYHLYRKLNSEVRLTTRRHARSCIDSFERCTTQMVTVSSLEFHFEELNCFKFGAVVA